MIIRKSISVLALVGAVLVSGGKANAQNQCSLRVRVLSPEEKRVYAVVSVREQDGRELEQDHKAKDLEFCDLGILPVTVTVHLGPGCNEITVRDLFLSLEKTYLLKVSYDPKNCSPELPPPLSPSCDLLLRIRDGDGRHIPNAEIHFKKPKAIVLRTDRYGRYLVRGGIGEPVAGILTALGYARTEFSVACTGYDPQEQKITMSRQ